MDKKKIKELLNKRYDRENWKNLAKNVFYNVEYFKQPKLIKTDKGVWVVGSLKIVINMDCIRCLSQLDVCMGINIDEEYRYDYFTDDKFDDNFIIDDSNHLSLKECLREYIFVTSPMKPVCNKICKL